MNTIIYTKNRLFSIYLESELHRLGYFITSVSSEKHLNYLLVENYDYVIICSLSVDFHELEICNRIIRKFEKPVYMYSSFFSEEMQKIMKKLGIKLITDVEVIKQQNSINHKLEVKRSDTTITLKGTNTFNIEVDFKRRMLKKDKVEIDLSGRELDLLKILIENKNSVIKKEDLIDAIWNGIASDTNVYITVQKLRRKLEADPQRPEFIITKKGGGYMLKTSD